MNDLADAQVREWLSTMTVRSDRTVRNTHSFGGIWPIELCIPRPVATLLAMFASHLICAIKASQLPAFIAPLLLVG